MSIASSSNSVNGEYDVPTPKNKGYQTDTPSPYFMYPNENPCVVLVTPLLSRKNYHSWSRAMQVALCSKYKLDFINDSLPRPYDDDHDYIAWDRCNTMIMSWLSNFVEPKFFQSILWVGICT